MSKTAVVLVGGLGKRLYPLTVAIPKPLVPVGETPILELVVRRLAHCGFTRVVLAVNHLAHLIESYFGDGSRWGVRIEYSLEPSALGTMGPLTIIKELPDQFLVMNGDILCDVDLSAFLELHRSHGSVFSVLAVRRQQAIDFGVLDCDSDNRLSGFREKPALDLTVSAGIYAVDRRVVEFIPPSRSFGFDQLMLDLLENGQYVRVVPFEGYWLDIGRPDDYAQAQADFAQGLIPIDY